MKKAKRWTAKSQYAAPRDKKIQICFSLSEPLNEATNRHTSIQVYDMSHWFVSIVMVKSAS